MNQTKFDIKEYSMLAASFLLVRNELYADVVYVDISPDTLINLDWEYFDLDLNTDGLYDYRFLKRSLSFTDGTTSDYFINRFSALYFGPLIFGNSVAGNTHVVYPSYGGFTVYFPYAISLGVVVDHESLEFQTYGIERLAYRFRGEHTSYFPYGGNWYPEVFDHYLGLYFKDTTDCYHYGWVRLNISDLGRELMIKEFAFETECNYPIIAGDTNSYVNISNENILNASVYGYGNKVFVQLNEEFENARILITNLSGDIIKSDTIKELITSYILNCTPGIYIVTIDSGTKKYSEKIFLF